MKNIYDALDNLAQAIKESPECTAMHEAQNRLKENPEDYQIAKEFFGKQLAVQTRQMLGQELSSEEIASFNVLATTVMGKPAIANYIQNQMAFMKIYQDL